jgi:hypothetical protein
VTRLRKFLALTRADQWLLIKASLLIGAIRLGLWWLPFHTLRRLLTRLAHAPTTSPANDQGTVDRLTWAVRVAGRYVPKTTCLVRALAAQVLLARRGQPARLHIGFTREEAGALKGHAWVERQGRFVMGDADPAYYSAVTALD